VTLIQLALARCAKEEIFAGFALESPARVCFTSPWAFSLLQMKTI